MAFNCASLEVFHYSDGKGTCDSFDYLIKFLCQTKVSLCSVIIDHQISPSDHQQFQLETMRRTTNLVCVCMTYFYKFTTISNMEFNPKSSSAQSTKHNSKKLILNWKYKKQIEFKFKYPHKLNNNSSSRCDKFVQWSNGATPKSSPLYSNSSIPN